MHLCFPLLLPCICDPHHSSCACAHPPSLVFLLFFLFFFFCSEPAPILPLRGLHLCCVLFRCPITYLLPYTACSSSSSWSALMICSFAGRSPFFFLGLPVDACICLSPDNPWWHSRSDLRCNVHVLVACMLCDLCGSNAKQQAHSFPTDPTASAMPQLTNTGKRHARTYSPSGFYLCCISQAGVAMTCKTTSMLLRCRFCQDVRNPDGWLRSPQSRHRSHHNACVTPTVHTLQLIQKLEQVWHCTVQCSALLYSAVQFCHGNCKSEHRIGTSHLLQLWSDVPCCLIYMCSGHDSCHPQVLQAGTCDFPGSCATSYTLGVRTGSRGFGMSWYICPSCVHNLLVLADVEGTLGSFCCFVAILLCF